MDLDGDGQRDILSGSYAPLQGGMAGLFQVLSGKPDTLPMAGLFQVLRGRPDGTFRKAEVLKGIDGQPLMIPEPGEGSTESICTRPFAIDWNGDGRLDLVVGTYAGSFYLFQGEGPGKFLPVPEPIQVDGQPLRIAGQHGDPFVIDWDDDGDLDLLSGSSEGGVQWAENQAGPGRPPQLKTFRSLIAPATHPESGQAVSSEDLKAPSSSTRIWVDDINSDGKLDILVGDATTLLSPAGPMTEAEFQQKLAAWNTSFEEATNDFKSTINDPFKHSVAQERYQKIYRQRSKFAKENMTGFIWLYLRK